MLMLKGSRRVTLNFGFFKRASALHAKPEYDEARVEALCNLIPIAGMIVMMKPLVDCMEVVW